MTLLLAALVVAVGATLQGSVGFGLGMFSVPFLLLLDPRLVPGPLLLSSLVLTVLLARREWRSIDGRGLVWMLGGRLVGVAAAGLALTVLSGRSVGVTFGVLVLLAVGMSASGIHPDPRPPVLLGAGVFSGFMGTTVSIGGPPIALVYQRATGPRIRGTLSAFFTVGVSLSLAALALVDRFGREEALLGAALAPGILVGYAVSRRIARVLDRGYVRTAVLVVSGAAGVVVLVRALV